jgi:ribonuclease HI
MTGRDFPQHALKLFFDGGCRPNPGAMEAAVVARGKLYHLPRQGNGSSDHAEWLALLHALGIARALGATDILLLGDSLAVVEQANRRRTCRRPEFRACLARFEAGAATFARVRIRHIARTQNLAGIALGKIREASRG